MGTRVIMVDDLDGYEGEDVAKRDFEVGGTTYTIDLGETNFTRLQDLLTSLAAFVETATEVKQAGRARKSTADSPARIVGYTNSDVRQWAGDQGIDISVRGKIADEVYDQFITAHPDAAPPD